MMRRIRAIILVVCCARGLAPLPSLSQGMSLFPLTEGDVRPLFTASAGALFDDGRQNIFAPRRARHPAAAIGASGIDRQLFDLIASAEAGPAGYDAVQHGARVPPPKPPTELTLDEIFRWIAQTPGQHHAIGRYQIIPATLRGLVDELGVPKDAIFSPNLQDRLALELVMGAGYVEFLGGGIERGTFLDNLARVWAGLPTASGRSHYHGYAGNRATMARSRFEAEMERVFPTGAED